MTQQVVEQHAMENEIENHVNLMSPSVRKIVGLDVHYTNHPFLSPQSKSAFKSTPSPIHEDQKQRHLNAYNPPIVWPGTLDKEIKRRTGFTSEQCFLAFIIIICNGNIDRIRQRHTPLTWYEEWMLYFELKWGRSILRIEDAEHEYGINHHFITEVISFKLQLQMSAFKSWPAFASYEEDCALRKKKWDKKCGDSRIIMWDMTNISSYSFGDSGNQRATYSSYYGENCFKDGVFCQPCGYIGCRDAWTGGVSDSVYNEKATYLDEQQQFQQTDLVNGEVIQFKNVYDKCYRRAKLAAWRSGRQLVLQPAFATSDRRFTPFELISSASVASDQSGNEWAVNVCKRSGYVRRGFWPGMNPNQFNMTWLTWGWQSNFMSKPIL